MCRPYVHVANESTLRPRPHEYFRSGHTFLYESALRLHEASESAHRYRTFLKPLSRVDFFGSDGIGEFLWTSKATSTRICIR